MITLTFKLPMTIEKKEKWHVSSCPVRDVFSQDETKQKAEYNLKEALCLFLTSCIERGTLETVLKDCGFKPVSDIKESTQEKYISIPLHMLSESRETCLV